MESYVRRQNNQAYYLLGLWRDILPRFVRRLQKKLIMRGWERRKDADYIRSRVDFYCGVPYDASDDVSSLSAGELSCRKCGSRYYFDLQRYLRVYPSSVRLRFMYGDVWHNSGLPTIAKARRIDDLSGNMTLMELDRRRHHLVKVRDCVEFSSKKPLLFFRGDISEKPHRIEIFRRFFDSPLMDLGDTSRVPSGEEGKRWQKSFVSVPDHFGYQFILCPEGNDVSSSLQWVMASNCVPVMTRPTVETWLMHSRMEAGVHYVEVAADYSDLEEKIAYYISHQDEAEEISRRSRQWARQFEDTRRESIISHLVLERYFGSAACQPSK